MDNYLDKLQQLKQQLLVLQNNQEEFGKQIHMLKLEIFSLEEEFSKQKLAEKPAQEFIPVTDFKKPEEVVEEVKISKRGSVVLSIAAPDKTTVKTQETNTKEDKEEIKKKDNIKKGGIL